MNTQVIAINAETTQHNVLNSLNNGKELINKSYLSSLGNCPSLLLSGYLAEKINTSSDVRIFKVERIVLENKQSVLESLTATYTALGSSGYSVFLLLKSDGNVTDVYLGTRSHSQYSIGDEGGKLLVQAFKGHFSGSKLTNLKASEVDSLLYNLRQTHTNVYPSVTAVTGVPSLAVEEREHFMQGLEHFIDAAEGQSYQALILAEPISQQQLNAVQAGYESVATQISPLLKQSVSFGENESESMGLSIGESISQSLGKSLSLTETVGKSESLTNTITHGKSDSTSNSQSTSESISKTTGNSFGLSLGKTLGGGIAMFAPPPIGIIGSMLSSSVSGSSSINSSESTSSSTSTSNSTTTGTSYSKSKGTTTGTSTSKSKGTTETTTDTYGSNSNRSINNTVGTSHQITLESVDKTIEKLLKQVEHQLERVEDARRYGGWNTAAYFIGDSATSSRSLASIFLGLMRGDGSNSENYALTTWKNNHSPQVLPWLANLSHPR